MKSQFDFCVQTNLSISTCFLRLREHMPCLYTTSKWRRLASHTLPVYHLQNHASASEFTHCNASSLPSKMQFEQEEMETTFLFLANNDYLSPHIEFYSAYCQQLISNRASNLDVHLVCITPSHLI